MSKRKHNNKHNNAQQSQAKSDDQLERELQARCRMPDAPQLTTKMQALENQLPSCDSDILSELQSVLNPINYPMQQLDGYDLDEMIDLCCNSDLAEYWNLTCNLTGQPLRQVEPNEIRPFLKMHGNHADSLGRALQFHAMQQKALHWAYQIQPASADDTYLCKLVANDPVGYCVYFMAQVAQFQSSDAWLNHTEKARAHRIITELLADGTYSEHLLNEANEALRKFLGTVSAEIASTYCKHSLPECAGNLYQMIDSLTNALHHILSKAQSMSQRASREEAESRTSRGSLQSYADAGVNLGGNKQLRKQKKIAGAGVDSHLWDLRAFFAGKSESELQRWIEIEKQMALDSAQTLTVDYSVYIATPGCTFAGGSNSSNGNKS